MLDFTCHTCGLETVIYSSMYPYGYCHRCHVSQNNEFDYDLWIDEDDKEDD
jgi:hypothetical protein